MHKTDVSALTKKSELSNFACWRLALQHRLTRFSTYLPKPVRAQSKKKQLQKTKQQLKQAPNKKIFFSAHKISHFSFFLAKAATENTKKLFLPTAHLQ